MWDSISGAGFPARSTVQASDGRHTEVLQCSSASELQSSSAPVVQRRSKHQFGRPMMATLMSCFVLLLVTVSCTTSQWSKPIAASGRRLSTLSEDWVPVISPCPTCPKETKVVARQADPLLQPPPAYQPSAQSAYIQQTLSAQQHEIQNHFNTQGLLPAFVQTPGQFFNEQFVTQQQTGASSQQLVSPEVSHQGIPAIPQLGSPQVNHQLPPSTQQLTSLPLNHQPISAIQQVSQLSQQLPSVTQQLTSPQPSHQEIAATQQLVSPQLTYQQVSVTQQPVSPKLSHQQISASQHLVSPQPSQKHVSATQLNNEQSPADQRLVSPLLNHKQQEVPHRSRRPSPSTTAPATQEEIQLLYVPVEALRQQQQVALLRQQQQQTKDLPNSTTKQPSTTLEPYQPPLSVFMGQKHGHNVKISDVVRVLKEAKTVSVLDTVGPDSPQVFIGPSNLYTPEGYAKFELPYLSALESNTIERKVPKPPFFVAPLSFKPPAGYSKIPFPAPHVGSVVIGNVTENVISKKDHARKTYSLPAELPPINPQLPSLVNSLQDQRNIPLAPYNQEVTKFLQAVELVDRETTTERYSRTKLSRNPYENSEVTGIRQRLPTKQTSRPFLQPITRYQETTTTTLQPQYLQPVQENVRMPTHSTLEVDVSKNQPSYSEFDQQSQLSLYGTTQDDISTRQPQTTVHNPTSQSQYQREGITENVAYTNSQKNIYEIKTNQTKHQDGSYRTQDTAYQDSVEDNKKWQSQYLPSEVKVSTKLEANNGSPVLQYPHLESVVITEQPQYIIPHQKIPAGQTKHSLPVINIPAKHTAIQEEISTPWPQHSKPYTEGTKYTTQDTIPRQAQHSVVESVARPSHFHNPVDDAQRHPEYSTLEENDGGKSSQVKTSQEGIIHRQPTNPVLEAAPENAQHDIPHANIPREQQYSGLYVDPNSKDYPTVQEDILLRPEGVDDQNRPVLRDEISKHRSQYPALRTDVSQKHSKHPVNRERTQSLHSQYQDTEQIVTAKPNYSNPQEQIPSHITQYANSPDKFQSQYPLLGSEVLTQSAVASTTTDSSVRTTPSRGRNRGRYRPSNFSTTTPTPRTRSSYSRGRRPVTRTTSESPEVQAISAGQVSPFESSRQPSERPHAHRSDTQQRDKTRSRIRGSSTTTTASPQYNADLHQENLYDHTPTQNSKTDTVSESFPNIISQRQQQAPSGQLTLTQFPNGQVGYTQSYTSQPPQSPSGHVQQNQFSNSQVSYTHLSSGLVSDVQIPYSQLPKEHAYHTHIPNAQNIQENFSNVNKAEQQIPIGQAAHTQNINDETSYFQIPNVQTTQSRTPYGTLDDAQTQNTKIAQNHVSGVTESHSQIHSVQDVNYRVPTGKLRSNQIRSEQPVNNQIPIGQAAQPKIPDDYYGHSASSTDGKEMSVTARTLSNTAAVSLQHDGFLQHELPEFTEYTTQRQHSPLPHDKYRTLEASAAYQTTFSPPTLDGKFREQGDSYIITTDKSAQDVGGDVTQKPSFVRIRGRIRGRPRTVQQPVEKTATIITVSPEFETTTVSRKHTNFINRGSARKTQAPTTTPTPVTTTPFNDKVYTVRPSRRPQQPQTRLTTKGRIRRPTRPPTTTSTLTTPSDHRLNEVPDAFTTEVIPTTRGIQFALQPEYDTSQQYQPKRQPYQSIQRTQEPLQQHQLDQHYQTIQRQQGTVQQYETGQHYQSIPPSSQPPIQQYRPDEQQDQQYLSVERSRVTDQISLPSDNQPQYGFNDPESGEESQWSGRTQPFSSNNAIPNVTKSIATLFDVTTERPERSEEADSTTETIVSTTEAATLILTALPDISTTSEKSTPGHSRRRGNWVRVRTKPQQQQDMFETAESQNLATVAAANQIPGETALKQIKKGLSNEGVLGNYSPTSPSSHAESEDDLIYKLMTEPSNTQELLRHQEDSFDSHNVPTYFKYENTTVDNEVKFSDNKNATEQEESPTSSPNIQGHHESLDDRRKHVTEHSSVQDVLPEHQSEVTSPFNNGYSSDEMTTANGENKFATTEDDFTNNDDTSEEIISSWLVPPSGLEDPWNQEEVPEETENPNSKQNGSVSQNKTSTKVNSSWTLPSSNLEGSWNQNLSRMITKSASTGSDDSDSKTTVLLSDTTTSMPEGQDSYIGSLLSSLGYYGKPKHDSDKNRNLGVYEDWWAKTYANHRPYYTDEQLNLSEENEKNPQDSTSIWNMDSFKTYEDSNNPADEASNASNTSLLNSTTAITESVTNVTYLEDYPHYNVWEDIDKNHHTAKHSVKKANPQNLYDKNVTIKDIEREPHGISIQDILATAPENTVQVADIATTDVSVDAMEFLELSTEHSGLNLTESIPAHGNLKETPYRSVTTERNVLSTSTEFFVVPSNAEHTFKKEHTLEDENVVGTDNSSYSETKQTPFNTEHSTQSSVSLTPEPNVKRTDTRSLMAKILGTTTSTKISHETEICYRGRCIKTKTKDSDIDQFSTD